MSEIKIYLNYVKIVSINLIDYNQIIFIISQNETNISIYVYSRMRL